MKSENTLIGNVKNNNNVEEKRQEQNKNKETKGI